MTTHRNPRYKDAFAVVSGLDRLQHDLAGLQAEVSGAASGLRCVLHSQQRRHQSASVLQNLQRQLAWLSGDVARMHAALEQEETHHGR